MSVCQYNNCWTSLIDQRIHSGQHLYQQCQCMNQQREIELVVRAQSGAVPAFEQLVVHYQDRLLRYLILRGLQHADAEDAVQTTFINAWQHLHSYRSRWRFSTWLYRIAGRVAAGISADSSSMIQTSDQDLADTDAMDSMLRDNIWQLAREQLSRQYFDLLWLHYGEGFSGAEIANIKQRSRVWVRVNLLRARRQLQSKVNHS